LIAQTPLEPRDASRLLVLDRPTGSLTHTSVDRLGDFLRPADLLVANNSRVLAARLATHKAGTGGKIELLLLHPRADGSWESLAKPARRLAAGTRLIVDDSDFEVEVIGRLDGGLAQIRLDPDLVANLDCIGTVPLPPYIHERLADPDRYQTVYSSQLGSAAAPTAGLHFTPELIGQLKRRGSAGQKSPWTSDSIPFAPSRSISSPNTTCIRKPAA